MLTALNSGWVLGLAMLALAAALGIRGMRELRRGRKSEALASGFKALVALVIASIGFFGPASERIARLGGFGRAHRLVDALVACGAMGGMFYIAGIALSICNAVQTRLTQREDGGSDGKL